MVTRRWTSIDAFRRDRDGNVAMMWALMGAVLLGLVGLTVDFTRAQMIRTQMQNAVDGAALYAARSQGLSTTERNAAARSYYDAEMGSYGPGAELIFTDLPDNHVAIVARMPMPLSLARLVGGGDWTLEVGSEAERGGVNIEVAMMLDVTGSMGGSRISNLRDAANDLIGIVVRDQQSPYYSRVGLAPYSMGVNAGSYATAARGAITGGRSLNATSLNWLSSTTRNISDIEKANRCRRSGCDLTVTSNGHGYQDGDRIYISGVNGMTDVNGEVFTVDYVNSNSFVLEHSPSGGAVNGRDFRNYSSGGTMRRCLTPECEVVFSSNNHGFSAGDYIYITGVNGMNDSNGAQEINNPNPVNRNNPALWRVGTVFDSNRFSLRDSYAPYYSNYNSGGTAYCLQYGCQYLRFANASNGTIRVHPISTCVSERTGGNRYTDAAPAGSPVGLNYPADGNPCLSSEILPLTSNRTLLTNRVNAMQAAGSTAGQIGVEWAWYLLSPNWSSLWPGSGVAAYNAPRTVKIAVIMTDGEFNTPYCNGVIAEDAGSGSGSSSDHINCNATNGNPFAQAQATCQAMKRAGVIIYTVGFEISNSQNVTNLLANCATSSGHRFMASNGQELRDSFRQIANSITQLRITR